MDASERRLKFDIAQPRFQVGVAEGRWDISATGEQPWPYVIFWIGAARRALAPDRYHVRLDLTNYPLDPPTGAFWDPRRGQLLQNSLRPHGQRQVGRVFRIDWKGGSAFYHPFDRAASRDGHTDWPAKYPDLVWTERHTITDLLSALSELLQSDAYEGLRGDR